MPADIDPNLKKNFVKTFVCDIKENVTKYDMVWVQGIVKEVITDDLVELQDVADSFATICQGTTFAWCSTSVIKIWSPLRNFGWINPRAKKLMDSVVPRVNTMLWGEGALIYACTRRRAAL